MKKILIRISSKMENLGLVIATVYFISWNCNQKQCIEIAIALKHAISPDRNTRNISLPKKQKSRHLSHTNRHMAAINL